MKQIYYTRYLKYKEYFEQQELNHKYWISITKKLEEEIKKINNEQDCLTTYIINYVKDIDQFRLLEKIFNKQTRLIITLTEQLNVSKENLKTAEYQNSSEYFRKIGML